MIAKIIGAFLLVGGSILATQLLGAIILGVFSMLWLAIKVGVVAGMIYGGWRLIDRPSYREIDYME